MSNRTAARAVLLSQLSLFGFLLACFVLKPHFLLESNEGGVSNYGLYAETVIPYTLALGLCSLLIVRASQLIPQTTGQHRPLRRTLAVLGSLLMVELVSTYPYKINGTFNDIHIYTGVTLFVAELIIGGWFAWFLARSPASLLLWAVQLAGFILAALTFFHRLHILFIAEMLASLAFGMLLVRTIAAATRQQE